MEGEQSIDDPAERIVVEVLGRPAAEQSQALEEAIAAQPELEGEVRARWLALQALGLSTAEPRDFPETLGDFRLVEPIGSGGMGVVYRAEQRSLGREVALKVLRPDRLYFTKAHERFRREVEAIAQLQHPGIVPVYSVGEEDGIPYFAMERIVGAMLSDVLLELDGSAPESLTGADLARAIEARSGLACSDGALFALDWVEACVEVARQVAAALHHAHERGILHRDVKPSNIALTCDGRVMLLDFGLASSSTVARMTEDGGQVGTLLYMAPEQVRGETELTPAVDVYGLGVSLHEMLLLQVPFHEETRLAIEQRILAGTRDPLRARNRRVPPELELVAAKALDVEPTRRYTSADELADDLRRIQEHRPVAARPIGPTLALRRWMQRHPALAVGVIAGVLLFVVGPSALFWRELGHARELGDSLESERAARLEAQEAFGFLERVISQANPAKAMDGSVTVREALEYGVDELDALRDQPRLQARLMLSIGGTFNALGQFEEALPLLERAAELERELGEPLDDVLGHPREALAFSLVAMNRLDEAEALLRELLDERAPGEYRGRVLYRLANVTLRRDRPSEAEPLLIEARDEYALRDDADGREGWIAISSLLSSLYGDLGQHERALAVAEECYDGALDYYAEGHPSIADALDAMANARFQLGDIDGAFRDFDRALEMLEQLYGELGLATARVSANYGQLLVISGHLEDGRSQLERAHEAYRIERGPSDATTRMLAAKLAQLGAR
jgi:tetratricopeptide (TPR) repeat protein